MTSFLLALLSPPPPRFQASADTSGAYAFLHRVSRNPLSGPGVQDVDLVLFRMADFVARGRQLALTQAVPLASVTLHYAVQHDQPPILHTMLLSSLLTPSGSSSPVNTSSTSSSSSPLSTPAVAKRCSTSVLMDHVTDRVFAANSLPIPQGTPILAALIIYILKNHLYFNPINALPPHPSLPM